MASSEEIKLIVSAEVGKATAEIKKLQGSITDLEKTNTKTNSSFGGLNKSMLSMVSVSAALYAGYNALIKPASNLTEQQNKFNVVFRENIDVANKWKSELVDAYAMSNREAMDYMSTIGNLISPMGLTSAKTTEMSGSITRLAADLASFNNTSVDDALNALRAGLTGEAEPLKRFGVDVSEAALKTEALNMGLTTGTAVLDRKTKMMAAYSTMLKQTTLAQGDMINTGDSWANVQKKIMARLEDLGASVGSNLLPALGMLGNAFLRATKDGGPLISVFTAIVKAMSWVVIAAANVVEGINSINSMVKLDKANGELEALQVKQREWAANAQRDYGQYKKAGESMIQTLTRLQKSQGLFADMKLSGLLAEYGQLNSARKEFSGETDKQNKSLLESANAIQKNMEFDIAATTSATAGNNQFAAKYQENEQAMAESNKKRKEEEYANAQAYYAFVGDEMDAELIKNAQQYEQLTMMKGLDDEMRLQMKDAFESKNAETEIKYGSQKAMQGLQIAQQASTAIMNILNQEQKARETKMNNRYNKEKALINMAITDEEQRKQAQDVLDLYYEHKKRQMKRETAVKEKAFAIVNIIIQGAVAMIQAFAQLGPIGGAIMAAVIGALTGVQVALVAATPIPAAAEGALIRGSASGTQITAGEGGRSEMIVPFENDEVMSRVGGGGSNSPMVSIQNFYAMGDAETMARELDRSLFKLKQDKQSLFASSIQG